MNPRLLLLVVCLAGNVVLAKAVLWHGSSHPRARNSTPTTAPAPNPLPPADSQAATPALVDNPAGAVAQATEAGDGIAQIAVRPGCPGADDERFRRDGLDGKAIWFHPQGAAGAGAGP